MFHPCHCLYDRVYGHIRALASRTRWFATGIAVLLFLIVPSGCNQHQTVTEPTEQIMLAQAAPGTSPASQLRDLHAYLASFGGVLRTQLALTISCPANATFECITEVAPAFTSWAAFVAAGGTGSSACGLDTNTFTVNEVVSGTCPTTITRTYQIDDSCAVTFTCMQTITVDDTTDPVITACPVARSLQG